MHIYVNFVHIHFDSFLKLMKRVLFKVIFLIIICSLHSCMPYRIIRYWTPDIDEYAAFPQEAINRGDSVFSFPYKTDSITESILLHHIKAGDTTLVTLDDYLKTSTTTAFIIIQNDTIRFEKYYNGYGPGNISTFFSTTKSVTSLLVGIAVDEGHIGSIHDVVTDYIPELKNADPNFQKLTIEHLLNMQAGFDFDESYSNPFKDMARLFYGRNQFKQLSKLKFICDPGSESDYNSATTALLGIVLERAVKQPYTSYLQEKVWKPLGMEYDASMCLDDKKHRSAKSYHGLSATAIDLAKIGRLYLNHGNWDGKQIVSKNWIEKSTTPNIEADRFGYKYKGYQYNWYNIRSFFYDSLGHFRQFRDSLSARNFADSLELADYKVWKIKNKKEKEKDYSAKYYWEVTQYHPQYHTLGIMNQILYVDPERKIIIVRLGKDSSDNINQFLMFKLSKKYPLIK